jgi:toxin YoeB
VRWAPKARDDYDSHDEKARERIIELIDDIERNPFRGLGKPEPLKHDLVGWWSRRVTGKHRLVYRISGSPPVIEILQCKYHY